MRAAQSTISGFVQAFVVKIVRDAVRGLLGNLLRIANRPLYMIDSHKYFIAFRSDVTQLLRVKSICVGTMTQGGLHSFPSPPVKAAKPDTARGPRCHGNSSAGLLR